jgi:2-dehydropantoate 2-reductase
MLFTNIARPSVIRHTGTVAKIHCGRLDRRPDAVLAGYVEQMKAAGIDITMSDHMLVEIWKKFVVLSGTSGITASTRHGCWAGPPISLRQISSWRKSAPC